MTLALIEQLKAMPGERRLAALLSEQQRRMNTTKLKGYHPWPKQREFHTAGSTNRERLFMANNQGGKSIAGAAEMAIHLTGRYEYFDRGNIFYPNDPVLWPGIPEWARGTDAWPNGWDGHIYTRPVRMWAAGVTSESVRDNPQKQLLGDPELRATWGTGFLPKDAIAEWRLAAGNIPNAVDHIVVKWGGGGDIQAKHSIVSFKTYKAGREAWQGPHLQGLWCDEEPPMDVYKEGLTRCNATPDAQIFITFTPLKGMSEVVSSFISGAGATHLLKEKD